ncbi:hypothetical protein M8J76_005009 [Diaphorina citri]|nr:hypothetical protein M8J76_005009 [Diaphorina citri]KAI5747683.1 hypothetical protein M8J77_017439 [Diaphorina citri]
MEFTLEFQIFYGIIGFSWIVFLFEFYLSIRQRRVYHETTIVPHQIAHGMDAESFEKSRRYSLDKNVFSMFKETVSNVMNTALLVCNGLPYFWSKSEELGETYFGFHKNEIVTSCLFIVLFNIFSTVIGLPISFYHHFVLEEKHGFNKQTYGFFVKDQIKSFIVSLILSIPLTGAVVYIIQVGGNMVFLYLWVFIILMSLFLMTIYPEFIAPLFDKYTPLPDGELKSRIEQLSASVKFPLKKLYVVEGSKRSEHSNAYFYGFFKNKRIVLFDTLLKDYVPLNADKKDKSGDSEPLISTEGGNKKGCDTEEVLAVLAHELGHWKYNHVLKSMIVMQLNLLFMLYSFQYLFQYPPLYSAFGFYDSQPILLGLIIVLQYVFAPYNQLVQFLMTCMTRRFEFQADAFGKSLGKAIFLRKALLKINKDNLGFPVCDWMFSLYHNSHPPLLERLQALDKDD